DHRRSGGVSSPRFDDAVSVSPVQTDQISPESSGDDLRLLRLGGFPEIVDPAGRRKNRRGRAVNRPFGTLQGLQRIGRRHRHRSADIPGGTPGGGSVISFRRGQDMLRWVEDRKSTRLNSSHVKISYAVFCLKKKKNDGERADNGHRDGN